MVRAQTLAILIVTAAASSQPFYGLNSFTSRVAKTTAGVTSLISRGTENQEGPGCGDGWKKGGWIGKNAGATTARSKEACLVHWQDQFASAKEFFVNFDPRSNNCYAKDLNSVPTWKPDSNPIFDSIRVCTRPVMDIYDDLRDFLDINDPSDADTDGGVAVPRRVPCVADEDCLQHPQLSRAHCPLFCVEGFCAPWTKDFPPPLRIHTGLSVDHTAFVLREEEDLEKVFERPPEHFPKKMLEGKFLEVVQGGKDILEVKYSQEFLKLAHTLEDPSNSGLVPGSKQENTQTSSKGDTELVLPVAGADIDSRSDAGEQMDVDTERLSEWWQDYNDAGSPSTQMFRQRSGKGRRLTTIQGQGFDRVHVHNHASYPWRMNGRLSVGCTASLIGNRVLLTAAHCVWDRETNAWSRFPTFAAGQDGADKPFGEKQVMRMTIPAGYMTCRTNADCYAHDWAVLVLRQDQALRVGYFGFSTNKNGQLNLPGYPRSKNQELWYDHCPLEADRGAWIKHRCDTERGNSGSAIYKIENDKRYIVAVHGGGRSGWNRGADVAGRTSSAGRLYDRMLAERMLYG